MTSWWFEEAWNSCMSQSELNVGISQQKRSEHRTPRPTRALLSAWECALSWLLWTDKTFRGSTVAMDTARRLTTAANDVRMLAERRRSRDSTVLTTMTTTATSSHQGSDTSPSPHPNVSKLPACKPRGQWSDAAESLDCPSNHKWLFWEWDADWERRRFRRRRCMYCALIPSLVPVVPLNCRRSELRSRCIRPFNSPSDLTRRGFVRRQMRDRTRWTLGSFILMRFQCFRRQLVEQNSERRRQNAAYCLNACRAGKVRQQTFYSI